MRALPFLPFTFAAGAEGFALFAPYLIVALSTLYLVRVLPSRQPLTVLPRSAAPLFADARYAL